MSTILAPLPNRAFDRLNQMMEDLAGFETFTNNWTPTLWSPSVDIAETEKEYMLKMDLPGFAQQDIEVELRGGVLSISGKRGKVFDEKKDGALIRYERKFGSFCRSFSLDSPVQEDAIHAKFENGVLSVTAPKVEVAKPKKIKVSG